jgi:predicted nuclease with RNAse H fold
VWIGVDPGGKNSFGLAFLDRAGISLSHCCSCAEEAVEHLREKPEGIGIDAPMWWSRRPSSDRYADQWIRKTHKIPSGTVQTANSLRGAVLVQGILFAEGVRRRYPDVHITETHPKAVLRALYPRLPSSDAAALQWSDFCSEFSIRDGTAGNEHKRDAIISAIAAREGFEGRWPIDLAKRPPGCEDDPLKYEQDPSAYWLAPMHYFWPKRGAAWEQVPP